MKRVILIVLSVLLVSGNILSAQNSGLDGQNASDGQTLWDLPDIPEKDIDIGLWALIIAKECDSTIEIDKYLRTLDSIASQIKYMVGPREGDMVRFMMTKMYQFDPGEWNDGQLFSYDLDDPMGDRPGARLLTRYLDTRKGNCVSMPTLFLALMERVDPDVPFNGVSAPLHLFCRLLDRQDSSVWNVETTNGGFANREQWYIESFGITPLALDSGTFMRDLSKKEFVAELLESVISKYRTDQEYEKALSYADLVLELSPKSLIGLVQKGALLGWLGHTLMERIKAESRRPTADEDRDLRLYKVESDEYIAKARSLGWEPETPEFREQYMRTVKDAKNDN